MNIKQSSQIDDRKYIRGKIFDGRKSNLRKYIDLVIGTPSLFELIKYEIICTVFGSIPGALGIVLRKIFYKFLFKNIGHNVVFGRSVSFRHPKNIEIGSNVIFDDYCEIDAHGAGDEGIVISDNVIVNKFASIKAKSGPIKIGNNTDIGSSAIVHTQGSPILIEDMVTVAGGCKISGGTFQIERSNKEDINNDNHSFNDREQKRYTSGAIIIGKKSILGIGSIILDGILIGEGCVIGAGAVVTHNIPSYTVAAGIPAKVLKNRK